MSDERRTKDACRLIGGMWEGASGNTGGTGTSIIKVVFDSMARSQSVRSSVQVGLQQEDWIEVKGGLFIKPQRRIWRAFGKISSEADRKRLEWLSKRAYRSQEKG